MTARDIRVRLNFSIADHPSHAAEHLRLDVATVRRNLAALEAAVGIKLFMKTGGSLQLTPDGERIYSIASRMAERGNEIVHDATDAARELVGKVRMRTTWRRSFIKSSTIKRLTWKSFEKWQVEGIGEIYLDQEGVSVNTI